MEHAPAPLITEIATWSDPAQKALWTCRTLFHDIAQDNDLGDLDETLKWGQPAWRPKRARTGSTLRIMWNPQTPEHLSVYVDCKTDLAARMQSLYPALPTNDGQRQITLDLTQSLPEQAISHLAQMTFRYHLDRRAT